MESSIRSGKLIKWKDERGFGFIQPIDGTQEVFLHISEVKDATRRPQENDTIYYHCVVDSGGKVRACNAFILGRRDKSGPLSNRVKVSKTIVSRLAIEVVLLSFLPLVGAIHFVWTTRNPFPLVIYPIMSLVTYTLYADDKSRAKRNDWRTSEQTLHLCELAGGWLGGFIAQRILHHKSQKKSYQVAFWVIAIFHYIVWLFWLFWARRLWF